MNLNVLTFLFPLLSQAGAQPTEEQVNLLKSANQQLRLNTCPAVTEAERLLGEAGDAGGRDSDYLGFIERKIARKKAALECDGGTKEAVDGTKVKKPERRQRIQSATPVAPSVVAKRVKTVVSRRTPTGKDDPSAVARHPPETTDQAQAQAIREDYRAARAIAGMLAPKCRNRSAVDRPACLAELRLARELQADLALDVLRAVPEGDPDWAQVRAELLVLWGGSQGVQEFLRQMQEKLALGDVKEADARAALDTPRDKFDLAVALSRAGGSAEVWNAFVQRVRGVLPEESRRALADKRPVDWVAVFAHLQDLSDERWELLKTRMEGMRIWDPHPRSDAIGLLYVAAEPGLFESARPFLNAFTPWMQKLSPQGARDRETWTGAYQSAAIDHMLTSARAVLSRSESSSCLPQALPQQANIERFLDWFLCGSQAGFVVVELTREDRAIRATTSWVVRQGGQQASFGSRNTSTTFPALEGRQDADDIQVVQADAGHAFAELLIFQRGVFPRLVEIVAQVEKLKCRACEEPTGTAWHAFLFAGLPYLADSKGSTSARLVTSGLDVATLFGSLAAMRWSIHERNRYSNGNERSFGDANDYLKMSGYLLLGTLAVRTAAAICYWSDKCRRWTQR